MKFTRKYEQANRRCMFLDLVTWIVGINFNRAVLILDGDRLGVYCGQRLTFIV